MADEHVPIREIVDLDDEGNPRPGPANYGAAGPIDPRIASLAAFLRARYDERETLAQTAIQETTGRWSSLETNWGGGPTIEDDCGAMILPTGGKFNAQYPHIAANDPQSVLDDVAAKRRLLQLHERVLLEHTHPLVTDAHLTKERLAVCASCEPPRQFRRTESWPCPTLKVLALPFAQHPDYREEWKP